MSANAKWSGGGCFVQKAIRTGGTAARRGHRWRLRFFVCRKEKKPKKEPPQVDTAQLYQCHGCHRSPLLCSKSYRRPLQNMAIYSKEEADIRSTSPFRLFTTYSLTRMAHEHVMHSVFHNVRSSTKIPVDYSGVRLRKGLLPCWCCFQKYAFIRLQFR